MSRLTEWLRLLIPLGIVWAAFCYTVLKDKKFSDLYFQSLTNQLIMASPILFIVLFAIYAVIVVLYRTLTFNDCPEAAEELQEQIKEATKFLKENKLID